MDFSEYYILLFSQNNFYTTTFTHSDGVTYTGICGGGWFFKSKDYNWSDNPDDWELVSFSSDNYAIEKIDTNIITYISANGQSVIANTTRSDTGQSLEKKAVIYLYCTQDIEGFCSAGSNYVEPEPDPEEEYRSGVLGVLDRIIDGILSIPELIINGIKDFLYSAFSSTLPSIYLTPNTIIMITAAITDIFLIKPIICPAVVIKVLSVIL